MFCKYCGNKLTKSDKFCIKCGKSTEENTIEQSTIEDGKGKAIASLIIGIVSIFFGGFLPLPIIGLVIGSSYKGKCTEKTAGIILNIIGIIISVITLIAFVIFGIVAVNDIIMDDANNSFKIDVDPISEWNDYSKYIESDELDLTTTIVGNWKELSTYKSLLTFSENEYYYYDDINNLEDNYTAGTYTIYNGMEELSKLEDNYSFLTKLINKLINNAIAENFYIIKLNPSRTVKDGVEVQNETNEEKLYRALYIDSHDDAVELSVSGYTDNEIKHYYKILLSNE